MNADELDANELATNRLVHDLNVDPRLPFEADVFDDAVCCVSVDYLTQPLEVFEEVARVVRPGGRFICTFSNRCFPSKAIRGWHTTDDAGPCRNWWLSISDEPGRGNQPRSSRFSFHPGFGTDPLFAVSAAVAPVT